MGYIPNALAAYSFRNSFLESLHAGVAGFSDEEMKKLMIETTAHLAAALFLRSTEPHLYAAFLQTYGETYCCGWSRDATEYSPAAPTRRPCSRCEKELRSSWSFCPVCGAVQRA